MNQTPNNAQIGKQMVYDTLESGIIPLTFDYRNVVFFGKETSVVRTLMVLHSLDVGTLTFSEYRFVARRTRQGIHWVKRHVEKLLRLIPKFLEKYPQIECFTLPVFPRMIRDGDLTSILYDAFALYPAVRPSQVCIEVSADILYEETDTVKARLEEIRALGVKVAISEVGDEFCPFFKLNQLPFDMILLDSFATEILDRPNAEQLLGGLIQYLRSFGVPVIAPELETDAQISNAKLLECDGYSVAHSPEAIDDAPTADVTDGDFADEEEPEDESGEISDEIPEELDEEQDNGEEEIEE